MKNYRFLLLALSAFTLMVVGPMCGSALALSLYDDFSGGTIDPGKWLNLEVVQEIRDGKLVSIYRAAGASGASGNDLLFANPLYIQSFQADVRLNTSIPPPGGSSRVGLRGSYYNDGTTTGTTGDATGDVRAQLYLHGTGSGADVRYSVYKCTNADCSTSTDVVPSATVKTAALGEVHTLAIAWDGAVFTFTVDGVPTVVDPRPNQPVGRSAPNVSEKALGVQVQFAAPGGTGDVAGDFDTVLVNGVPYDDFSGPHIDPVRWASLDVVREVVDGRLVSKVAVAGPVGTRIRNLSQFVNQNAVTALSAEVTVTAFQSSNSAVQVRALAGSFYNDGASTGGDDNTGDIQAVIRIYSLLGGPLTVQFFVRRCDDAQCSDAGTALASVPLGQVSLGQTHTLSLVWDGSVFTYGMDGVSHAFDPKPGHPVAKPPTEHYKDLRTDTDVEGTGGYGYIAVTFDNVFLNDQAVAPPRLAPFIRETVTGDVTSAGIGLRGKGTDTINLTGIPSGATVQRAFLYWATLGTAGTFTSPTLNGIPVAGTLIGQSDDPFWGANQSFAYRADVTSLVSGNGLYTVAGLPKDGPTVNDSQGASLVAMYSLPGAPLRIVTINDGAVTLSHATLQFYSTSLGGFVVADPPTGAKLTFVVGDGQAFAPDYAGLNATLLATSEFNGSDGSFWDTRTYDVSAALAGGATSADAIVSTGNESLVWVAAILSVPGASSNPTLALSVNQSSFHAGQQLTLNATVTPGPTPTVADVYVALQLPDGSLLFLQGDGSITSTLQPIVRNWIVGAFTGQIFAYIFGGGEPVGNYAWLAAFTQPGTLNFIGPIVSAPFSFSP